MASGVEDTVPATLRVTREGSFGFELRRGTFDVVLDGETVRSIEWGETMEGLVKPGRHTLRIRKHRYSSLERSFEAGDSEPINFRCHGAMLWPRWLVSFAVPSLAISLKRA
jgi:hypothetical protein